MQGEGLELFAPCRLHHLQEHPPTHAHTYTVSTPPAPKRTSTLHTPPTAPAHREHSLLHLSCILRPQDDLQSMEASQERSTPPPPHRNATEKCRQAQGRRSGCAEQQRSCAAACAAACQLDR